MATSTTTTLITSTIYHTTTILTSTSTSSIRRPHLPTYNPSPPKPTSSARPEPKVGSLPTSYLFLLLLGIGVATPLFVMLVRRYCCPKRLRRRRQRRKKETPSQRPVQALPGQPTGDAFALEYVPVSTPPFSARRHTWPVHDGSQSWFERYQARCAELEQEEEEEDVSRQGSRSRCGFPAPVSVSGMETPPPVYWPGGRF